MQLSLLNNRKALTLFTRVTWAVIYAGRDIVRVAEALKSYQAAHPASGSEAITLLARISWKLREAVKALGERWESRVFEAHGVDQWGVLGLLMDSAAGTEA